MDNDSIASLMHYPIRFQAFRIIEKITEIDSSAFIVGGYLRKLLRGKESLDIDIVTGGDIKRLSETVAKDVAGTIVTFKKAGIIRVVSDGISLDFSEIQGSLYDDLSKRDFTINAIAWSPSAGLFDPFKGITDIKKGIIRAISEKNLKDDPLRLLRAYRFVAEEGYRIDSDTRRMIKRLRKALSRVAKERITSELFKMLLSDHYKKALRQANEDGLLQEIISISRDRLHGNIRSLSRMDHFIESLNDLVDLDNEYSQGLTYRGLLRLERLLINCNLDKNSLTLSRSIWKRLKAVTEAFGLYRKKNGRLKNRTLFDTLYELKEASLDFSLLTGRRRIFLEARLFLKINDQIRGDGLAETTGLSGKAIGDLLKELRYTQYLEQRKTLI